MNNIFYRKLSASRKMAGLSLQEVADKVGVSKNAIFKYENNEMMPDSQSLIRLCRTLNVTTGYFFNNELSGKIELVDVEYREQFKLEDSEMDVIKKDTEKYLERLFELEKVAGINYETFKNPVANINIKSVEDVSKAVKVLRKKWQLATSAISNVIDLIEGKGVRVFQVFQSEKFEGFSAWAGEVPVIVINGSIQEVTRIRFTALHELGHIVLCLEDGLSYGLIERICDEFAGALLFPHEIILVELGHNRTKISIQELKLIKEKYGISIQAIMVRAAIGNIINWDTYKKWKKYYEDCIGNNEDFGKYNSEETPRRFDQLLYNCLAEEKISISRAAILSEKKVDALKKEKILYEHIYN